MRQWPKFGKETMAFRPILSICSAPARVARSLDGLGQDDIIEAIIRIIREIVSASPWMTARPLATQAATPSRESSMPRASTCLCKAR